ncbi:MAG: hypothetical protein Unbinned5350contig1004_24 [Prokaryotic dsDNA virus sp.]|nr:MAG: hypothetical protein Unbinned5350contig1004_24 [Prokaryotic dsDNA virus sp.]|tara:strand:- start:3464 stop:3664 length:201 start_codon:yes stop_codon:yes gene_type:complete
MNYYIATLNFSEKKPSQVKEVRFSNPVQIGEQAMIDGHNFKIFNLIHIEEGHSQVVCDCMDVVNNQ